MEEDILTQISKEKFRRRLSIASRVIAICLILAIVWIGYVQMTYSKEVLGIKSKYGSLGYCYLCGLENYRSCSCNYIYTTMKSQPNWSLDNYAQMIADSNLLACPSMEINRSLDLGFNLGNISSV